METLDTLKIVQYPHPALRWKSKPLKQIDRELRAIVARMFELMYEAEGVGLAANQVSLPYQLFVIDAKAGSDGESEKQVLVNPVILNRKGSHEAEEGCLSLPKLYGQVRRAKTIEVSAYDLDGNESHLTVEGLSARVIQHEHDHLEGTLFIDRMSELGRRDLEPHLEDFRLQYRRRQQLGEIPPEREIHRQLKELEALRT